jgi:predicted DNA-binding transcriptional regulator AlpA
MTNEEPRAFLKEPQAAKWLNCSPSLLRKMRRLKVGPPWLRIGAAVRYDASEVAAWIKANTQQSA